ncbi:MAG TPA: hypothetical protein VN905_04880, partial [Candidatus Binatia bacterium]|nr:hypothetical protein [Candidatus Binatia bacterium]
MNMRRFAAGTVALLVIFATVVLPVASQPSPFIIDAIAPLTGPQAFTGAAISETLRVFETWTNEHGGLRGQPIHFDIRDDQSNPAI